MTTHDPNHMSPQEEILLALVEGELDPAREAAVVASLDAVAVARIDKMRRQRSLLCRVGEVAPRAGLVDRAMAVLEREAVTGPFIADDALRIDRYQQPRATGIWPRRLAIAAGLALLVGGAGYWALRFSATPPLTPGTLASATGVTGSAAPVVTTITTPKTAEIDPALADATGSATFASRGPAPAPDVSPSPPEPRYAIATSQPPEPDASTDPAPPDFDDDDFATAIAYTDPSMPQPLTAATGWQPETAAMPVTMGVFSDMPASLDPEHAAELANEGRLVIRVRADRPALAAARLLSQIDKDKRASKGRMWRLMPCPPPDFSEATEAALPPRTGDDAVPYRSPMRPVIETTLSIELDPSASSIAMIQAELEIIARGSVIFDMLDQPVTMAPPCGEDGALRGWTAAPTSVVHTVVVPLVVESNE